MLSADHSGPFGWAPIFQSTLFFLLVRFNAGLPQPRTTELSNMTDIVTPERFISIYALIYGSGVKFGPSER